MLKASILFTSLLTSLVFFLPSFIFLVLAYADKNKPGKYGHCYNKAIVSIVCSSPVIATFFVPMAGLGFMILIPFTLFAGILSWITGALVLRFRPIPSSASASPVTQKLVLSTAALILIVGVVLAWSGFYKNDKMNAAGNSGTSIEDLQSMLDDAFDEDSSVLLMLAQNRNASSEILDRICETKHPYVRPHVANNPNTSTECLKKLASDSNPYVKDFAEKALKGRVGK